MRGSAPALVAEAIGTFLFFFIAAGAALAVTGDPAAALLVVALALAWGVSLGTTSLALADAARQGATNQSQRALPLWLNGGGRDHHRPPPPKPDGGGRTPIVGNPPGALQPFNALPGGSFSPAIRGEKRETEQR